MSSSVESHCWTLNDFLERVPFVARSNSACLIWNPNFSHHFVYYFPLISSLRTRHSNLHELPITPTNKYGGMHVKGRLLHTHHLILFNGWLWKYQEYLTNKFLFYLRLLRLLCIKNVSQGCCHGWSLVMCQNMNISCERSVACCAFQCSGFLPSLLLLPSTINIVRDWSRR